MASLPVRLFDGGIAPSENYGLLKLMDFLRLIDHDRAVRDLGLLLEEFRNPSVALYDPEDDPENLITTEDLVQRVICALKSLRDDAQLLQLDSVLITLTVEEYEKRLSNHENILDFEIRERLAAIKLQYEGQCERKKLFRLTDAEGEMFDNQFLFGAQVAEAFSSPGTLYEIRETGSCFALGRYTAAVFHLMRVLERGLRAFATRIGAGLAADFEYENWHNVIDRIEAKIKALQGAPKGIDKIERLKEYSEAAKQFRYFKDAWRNHVAHSRQSFEYEDAAKILRHVREFMQDLAKIGIKEVISINEKASDGAAL